MSMPKAGGTLEVQAVVAEHIVSSAEAAKELRPGVRRLLGSVLGDLVNAMLRDDVPLEEVEKLRHQAKGALSFARALDSADTVGRLRGVKA